MKIVSWQTVLTDHQSHTLRALQDRVKEPIEIISGVRELAERKAQGWSQPDTEGLHVRYLPSSGWWREGISILREHANAIHLFNGLWGDRRFFFFLLEAQRRRIFTGLVTEPYSVVAVGYLKDDTGFAIRVKSVLRPYLYRLAGVFVAKNLRVVFAISEKAVNQFIHIGVKREVIVPFGYFVPPTLRGVTTTTHSMAKLRVIFVGTLIERKGIRMLVEVMRLCQLRNLDICLDVYGTGDASIFKGIDRISYRGVIPFGSAQGIIANYDLLFLPSLYDGWGVVVNEALMQGVPVLLSEQVGAKTLIEKSEAGSIFQYGQVDHVINTLENLLENPVRLSQWKCAAKRFRAVLTPDAAAKYMDQSLQDVLQGKRCTLKSPWYR